MKLTKMVFAFVEHMIFWSLVAIALYFMVSLVLVGAWIVLVLIAVFAFTSVNSGWSILKKGTPHETDDHR